MERTARQSRALRPAKQVRTLEASGRRQSAADAAAVQREVAACLWGEQHALQRLVDVPPPHELARLDWVGSLPREA